MFNYKMFEVMARPIAATPPLRGQDAIDFLLEMERCEKVTPEEMERIKAGAERIQKMIDFDF